MQSSFKPDGWDGLALAGALLVAGGLWWIYPPAALIAVGSALVAFAFWAAGRWRSEEGNR